MAFLILKMKLNS